MSWLGQASAPVVSLLRRHSRLAAVRLPPSSSFLSAYSSSSTADTTDDTRQTVVGREDGHEFPPGCAEHLAGRVLEGDVCALSRAITLVESAKPSHRRKAAFLLRNVLEGADGGLTREEVAKRLERSRRVGVSGPPGVGKSTLIERLGSHLVADGKKVAVLAIDPSSRRSGGAILGDKTRMPSLASAEGAFVRPSPTGLTLGGVARATGDAAMLCAAAGYDWVVIETVGVGQSEVAVADIVDSLVLVLPPAGGDELQGIKRGIMEEADIIVVNKADGKLVHAAQRAAADVKSAVPFIRARWASWLTSVQLCSAGNNTGITELVTELDNFFGAVDGEGGELEEQRRMQRQRLMWTAFQESVLQSVRGDEEVAGAVQQLEEQVRCGAVPARAAAEEVAALFLSSRAQITHLM